jgi:hypothetical protein
VLPVVVQAGDGKVFQFPSNQEARQFELSAKEAGGETLRLVPALPPAARPLYDLETHLAALLDTEEIVPDELEREYALELHATLVATVKKRDRVGQFLAHLETQIALAHAEVARLQMRETFYTRAFERMQGYVMRVIDSLGVDDKGKRQVSFMHQCSRARLRPRPLALGLGSMTRTPSFFHNPKILFRITWNRFSFQHRRRKSYRNLISTRRYES